jgi:hypothetical protein
MRSQSAIEYLITYGWALLIISIALAAFTAFGLFNSGNFVGNSCTLPNGLSCKSAVLSSNGMLTLDIGQDTGSPITITGVSCDSNQTAYGGLSTSVQVGINGNATFTPFCYSGTVQFTGKIGQVYHGFVIVNYTSQSSSISQEAIGALISKVQN